MNTPTTVYYHADCLDGFGAAYAAWRRLGDGAAYRPVHHGQDWDAADIAGRDVFILDFSFPARQLGAIAGLARSLLLLDHHASARREWEDKLEPGAGGLWCHRDPNRPLAVAFDLGKSGARLAWEHFHPDVPLPPALAHIEDLDLWRFALPETRPLCRALRLLPFDFRAWDEVVRSDAGSPRHRALLAEGEAIERFCALEVERLAAGGLVMPVVLAGEAIDPLQALRHGQPTVDDGDRSWRAVRGLAINAGALFASELGQRLARQSGSFGLVWQLAGDGSVRVSLRAEGGVDVARLAERYGGGGHANAAGFRMPAAQFFAEILKP